MQVDKLTSGRVQYCPTLPPGKSFAIHYGIFYTLIHELRQAYDLYGERVNINTCLAADDSLRTGLEGIRLAQGLQLSGSSPDQVHTLLDAA